MNFVSDAHLELALGIFLSFLRHSEKSIFVQFGSCLWTTKFDRRENFIVDVKSPLNSESHLDMDCRYGVQTPDLDQIRFGRSLYSLSALII